MQILKSKIHVYTSNYKPIIIYLKKFKNYKKL